MKPPTFTPEQVEALGALVARMRSDLRHEMREANLQLVLRLAELEARLEKRDGNTSDAVVLDMRHIGKRRAA